MRILIVDDSAIMRTLIKRVLALTDVRAEDILEAANGAEALRILKSQDVQVLFTDINMPEMTGVELLQQLAEDDRYSRLTRVVISTDGSASRREEVAGLEVRCYLEKPFTPEVMRDVLNEVAGPAGA